MDHITTPDSLRFNAVEDLKATSLNYARWQESLALRDAIVKANGLGTQQYEDARSLIVFWNSRWQQEMKELTVALGNEVIEKKVRDMVEEMNKVANGL